MNENPDKTGVSATSKGRLSRKWRFGTIAAATTVVVVAVVLLLNMVMNVVEARYPLTVDLTADGTFTLSAESKTLAKGVEQPVEIVVFVNENLFTTNDYSSYPMLYQQMYAMSQYYGNEVSENCEVVLEQFYNLLKEYQKESGGLVTYRFVDMDSNPVQASAYQDYAVAAGDVLFLCDGRYQKFSLSELMSFEKGSTAYTLSYYSEAERLVAAKINLVSASVVKKAVMLTGHGESTEAIDLLESLLASNGCEVESLDITASSAPPDSTDVFVIAGATTDYTTEEITKLRGWLDNDGKRERDLVVFVSPMAILTNLHEMLADEYGIVVEDELVSETDADNVYDMIAYYTYADVAATDYTEGFAGQRALMPMTRPLTLKLTESTDESTYSKPLITFGETARVQELSKALATEEEAGEAKKADSYPIVAAAYTTDRLYDNNDNRYYTTDVMVFGSVMFAHNMSMDLASACNEEMFLNTFRGLTGLESVISVSNRPLTQETLDFGGSKVPAVLGLGVFTIGLPIAMIVLAVVVFVRRRRL